MCELLLQIGDVDGARKKIVQSEGEDEEEKKKAKKQKTIMSRANGELNKPEDDLL